MRKKVLSVFLIIAVATSAIACQKKVSDKPNKEVKDESINDSYSYNISALLSEDNTYNQVLLKGFSDCLTDYLGEDHFTITTSAIDEQTPADMLAAKAVSQAPDMIFTAGKSTLLSAKDSTDNIPIIATGIIDFKNTLRIASLNGKSWDKTTGTNVTGISSKPSIVQQVSLMIEATEDLQTVGILFNPEDTDSIYQNEIFEAYLNQAGIPWKEYLMPSKNDSTINYEQQNSTALSPSKYVAFSAKQGMNNDVTTLGEDTPLGLNSTSSTRVALVSDFWTGGKVISALESEESNDDQEDDASSTEENTSDETTAEPSDENTEEAPDTMDSLIREVCHECSAIYIPYGSMLSEDMNTIGTIAADAGVTVVAGDTTLGTNALVTLFEDPYSLGYDAGKKAIKVLGGEDISTVKISSGDSENTVKLYNGEIAAKLDKTFPKSFKELNSFLETYEYGSTTNRYTPSGE